MSRKVSRIDSETGELKNFVVKEIYLYLARENKNHNGRGYFIAYYGPMAYHVGLPYVFAGYDNAETIVWLRSGLRRLERIGLIKVKPRDHTTVWVLITLSPHKLRSRYGDNAVNRLFGLKRG